MALTSSVSLTVVAALTGSADLGVPRFDMNYIRTWAFASGAGADEADMVWTDTRTLVGSAAEDLDLAAASGGLDGHLGGFLNLARLKFLLVRADDDNTNNVVVSRKATTGAPFFMADGDAVTLPPKGCVVLICPSAAGYVVTATTDDTITITNSAGGTDVTYEIIVLGATS